MEIKDDKGHDKCHGHGNDKVREIYVNTRDKEWLEKEISFNAVVELAYGSVSNDPNVIYTITYKFYC